jgi:acetyl-CoA synthetase
MAETGETIRSLLEEERTFPPPDDFKRNALIVGTEVYGEADTDHEGFWARAADALDWYEDWHTILEWDLPFAKWFVGGKLNVAYNCLDRHVEAGRGDKVAYYWEGEPGDTRAITYAQLLDDVSRLANALKALGVEKGDRVNIYLGMVPELPMALLACARIGAAHSVVFGGFSADSLRDRIRDAGAKVLITGDGAWRRGSIVPLKTTADLALADCPSIERVLVLQRTGQDVPMTEGRDVWWHDLVPSQDVECPPEPMDSEDLLFLLYTSGTTARPKGIMHTTGGYLTQVAWTHKHVFDLHPDDDVYWCAADVGWVTGHSYIVYGPLANGATSVMYEGTPDFPEKDRLWRIVETYGVTILYLAPTAIRSFMKWGAQWPQRRDLSSLRLLGSVGEPINPEAWVWYWEHIGGERCPIVDTWWQTETGAIMISPLPGATTRSASRVAGTSSSPDRGRRCCGASGATRSATATRTGVGSTAATSPVTARSATTTASSGCSAGSTTSCSSRVTTSRPPRSSTRWWAIPRSPRPRWWGPPTPPPARRSRPS